MISLPLAQSIGSRHAGFLAISGLLLALFQFLICAVVGSVDFGGLLGSLLRSIPPFMQAVVTSQFGGLSERDLLAFGWNHPVAQALGTAAAIVLAVRAVAGESETGALELLLSQPLSRSTYLGTRILVALLALALLTLAGTAGTRAGQAFYGLEPFESGKLLALAANYFLLQSAWFGVTLALSAFGREGGRIATAGFLLALVSYFAEAIGRLWSDAAWVLPWTLHHYFAPREILIGEGALVRPLATLGALSLAGLGVAAWRFGRRDLP